jgi:hypothetical protein
MHTTLKSLVFLKSLVLITLLMGPTGALAQTASSQNAGASPRLLTPQNSTLVLIDHQPQMAFAAQSMDTQLLINNVTGLAKAAKIFSVPTILTTVASKTFSGPIFPTVQAVYPDQVPIDRTIMNTWGGYAGGRARPAGRSQESGDRGALDGSVPRHGYPVRHRRRV